MNTRDGPVRDAAALRRAFDRSFADAPASVTPAFTSFLAVRIGDNPYAIELSELAGLHRDRTVVPASSPDREFLGIASVRGAMVPVYDLRALLGYPSDGIAPRWLVLSRAPSLVGLAFDLFEAYLRTPSDEVPAPEPGAARLHVRGVVRAGDAVRPLIHVASVLEAIGARAFGNRSPKEP